MKAWNALDRELILASKSPRRREILSRMGFSFTVRAPQLHDEGAFFEGGSFADSVRELARAKALSVGETLPGSLVLGGDTVVCLGQRLMGKPAGVDEAADMLSSLSGVAHEVYSGIALVCKERGFEESGVACTTVHFRKIPEGEIEAYLESGEYRDKAGAYAIQGDAMRFVDRIEGCFYNVVGLPVAETLRLFDAYRSGKDNER